MKSIRNTTALCFKKQQDYFFLLNKLEILFLFFQFSQWRSKYFSQKCAANPITTTSAFHCEYSSSNRTYLSSKYAYQVELQLL